MNPTSTFAFIATGCSAQTLWNSPLGPIRLVRADDGLAGLWFVGQRHEPPLIGAPERPDDPLLQQAIAELGDYFAGRRRMFGMPLALRGTPFQRAVWRALLGIASGSRSTYADVARQVGASQAVRAVGAAVGRNPISVIVPCHRVVGSDGTLTGYAGGLDRKRALLAIEAAHAPLEGTLL